MFIIYKTFDSNYLKIHVFLVNRSQQLFTPIGTTHESMLNLQLLSDIITHNITAGLTLTIKIKVGVHLVHTATTLDMHSTLY